MTVPLHAVDPLAGERHEAPHVVLCNVNPFLFQITSAISWQSASLRRSRASIIHRPFGSINRTRRNYRHCGIT